ncbi:MAG TPA: sulfate ABC transporter ATP-binding protein [Polyangiaceae bacterium]|nr:sulfate ABC transporter ATP-binding protein [Polyangiaceae bacterium]
MSIAVRNVTKRFGTFVALDDVSIDVRGGGLVALLGPSGSGKTTLLRILAGLEQPDAGSIALEGADAARLGARERNVGLVFQHYALFRHLDVYENIAFALRVRKRPHDEVDARVRELLRLIQLEGHERRKPSQLSGGQRQRVALARALAASPRVLLLDEPFGALDAQVRAELRDWLRRLHDELHVTTVFVTHDQDEAFEVADRVVVMNHGKVEQEGSPAEVFDQPASDFVMRFLGHVNLVGDRYIRPHDIELTRAPADGAIAAKVVRVTPRASGIKVEVDAPSIKVPDLRVEVDWRAGRALALAAGDDVYVHLPCTTRRTVMKSRLLASILVLFALGARAHAQPATPAPAASTDPPATSTSTETAPVPAPAPSPEPAPAPAPPPVEARTYDAAEVEKIVDDRLAAQPQTAGWKDGFFVQTADGKTKLKIGGFTQFDGRFFVDNSNTSAVDQFGFRSIRPDLQGTIAEHFDFRLLPDFAGAKVVLQDVYADIHYGDAVKLRFGKFKVPFGLERLQAETATTFVERGLPTLLAPNRDLGVQVFGEFSKGLFAYQVGVFNGVADGASGDGDVSNGKEVAARVFVQPGGGFGVGAAATYGNKNGTVASPDLATFKTQAQTTFFQYKSDPNPLMPTLATTPVADGHHYRASAQADWYRGPIGVLAEYVRSVQRAALGDTASHVGVDSWQVVAQWVITGDDATYKSVAPKKAFDPTKGQWGAFDVAARAGQLSLDDNVFADGLADRKKSAQKATSFGVGADWFPNKNFRFVLDLERTQFDGGPRTSETSIVGRVQTVF